jgi:hypothetical protein
MSVSKELFDFDDQEPRRQTESSYGPALAGVAFFGTFFIAALWSGMLLATNREAVRILGVAAGLLSFVTLFAAAVAFVGSAKWYASTRRPGGLVGMGAAAFAFLSNAGFCAASVHFLILAAWASRAALR